MYVLRDQNAASVLIFDVLQLWLIQHQ